MNSLTAFFDWLLTASLRASLLTLAVGMVQFILCKHLSPRWRYALWLPVLVVLLMPVLPESRWSLESVMTEKPQIVEIAPAPLTTPLPPADLPPAVADFTPASVPIDWQQIRLLTWASGAALALLAGGLSFTRTLQRFQRTRQNASTETLAQLKDVAREVGLRRPPRLLVASTINSPAVTGLLRPVLLLPAGFGHDFTPAEAHLILRHELTHLKRHDLPLNTLLCVLMALHWFNPLLWLAFFMARADREAACDAQVLENATPQRRSEYGHALLKIESAFTPFRLSLGFVGMLQRHASLRARIRSIASPTRTRPLGGLLATAGILGMTFLGITRAEKPAATEPPHEETKLIAIEVTTVHFKQDTSWDFDGRFKQLDPEDPEASPGGQIALLSQEDVRILKEKLQKEAGAEVSAYPRMVTQDGKEVMIRSVVNQPVLGGKDTHGKSLIAYVPIGFVAKFTPRALADDRVAVDIDITDSRIVATETIQGSDYPVASSQVFRGPVELKLGITAVHYAWQGHGWKGNKPASYRPTVTFITTHVLDPKAGGLPADASGFATGKASFRPGDSIRITNVQRGAGFLTVTADYELASEPEARLFLHITSSKDAGWANSDPSQFKTIPQGKGSVTLHHSHVIDGMPHLSFYPARGGDSFGSLYFGTQAEADASQKINLNARSAAAPPGIKGEIFLGNKLARIILPRVQFKDTRIAEAIEFLRVQARVHDTTTTNEKLKGVPIILRKGEAPDEAMSLDLKHVTLLDALRYVSALSNHQFKVEPFAVIVSPATDAVPKKSEAAHPAQTPPPHGSALIIPEVILRDATLAEALDFIRARTRAIDPDHKGVTIHLRPGIDTGLRISVNFKDIPASEALRYIASLGKCQLTTDAQSYHLAPAGAPETRPRPPGATPDTASAASVDTLRTARARQYDFSKAILRDVLRYLATDAGIKFIALPDDHPTGSKLVTFSIKASPFQTLETLCRAQQLTLVEDQGVWLIRPSDDTALTGKDYPLPATQVSSATLLEDIRALLAHPPGRSIDTTAPTPTVTFQAEKSTFHVRATHLQHTQIDAYFKGLKR
jgi:beta-lactamase regulating signal transducer with metallopeptidase domain